VVVCNQYALVHTPSQTLASVSGLASLTWELIQGVLRTQYRVSRISAETAFHRLFFTA